MKSDQLVHRGGKYEVHSGISNTILPNPVPV